MKKKTAQENFWKNKFGDRYTLRNIFRGKKIVNVIGKQLLKNKIKIKTVIEIGCNIGLNLRALKKVYPKSKLYGIEINKKAFKIANRNFTCFNKSIYEFEEKNKFDLVISSGVMIHQNPKKLRNFYKIMETR